MDALRSLVQPLVGAGGGSSVIDGVKLVVLGTTVETARRVSSSAWSHFVNSFFLTAHFSEEDYPSDWLMLWLSRRPEWQRSREFETTTRNSVSGLGSRVADNSFGDEDDDDRVGQGDEDDTPGRVKTRVVFQPTFDTTHTIYYRGHWLRVKRSRNSGGCEVLSISVVARNNSILKQLVLQAKKEYEAESIHRIQIYFADSHGSWRWTDSRHKRPMSSIVLNPGVKEMLLADTKDFLRSEKWYADRGIPFRRGYLLYGVPGSGKSSLIHAIAGELMLDIYVVSLSSSWINDSTLTTLMGRVPARCIVLLEDLDAAFTRSVTRDDGSTGSPDKNPDSNNNNSSSSNDNSHSSSSRSRRHKDPISDVNTLSLSGLLNALDGVAAAEGRLLFATTNHLERLDPALSRPGRMDVWIEFKNASKWQAEALFKNFFPSSNEDDGAEEEVSEAELDAELAGITIPTVMPSLPLAGMPETPITPVSGSLPTTTSSFSALHLSQSSSSLSSLPSTLSSAAAGTSSTPRTESASLSGDSEESAAAKAARRARREEEEHAIRHAAPPLSNARLAELARVFYRSIPEEEFSVAALQGYLLKNKTRPEAAAYEAASWVVAEREMREKLKREKAAREAKEKAEREKKRKEEAEKKAAEEKVKAESSKTDTPAAESAPAASEPAPSTESKDSEENDSESSEDTQDENSPPSGSDSWQPVTTF
jgi:chaperone BCS1